MSSSKSSRFRFIPQKRWQKIVVTGLTVVLALMLIVAGLGLYTYQVGKQLQAQAMQAQTIGQEAYAAFKDQDLVQSQAKVKELQQQLQQIKQTYHQLSFYRTIPVIKNYYLDGEHGLNAAEHGLAAGEKTITTLTPYADVLGFKGGEEGGIDGPGGVAENRIKLVLETLDKVMPEFDEIETHLTQAEAELAQIDPQRYPEEFKGMPVRAKLTQVQTLADQTIGKITSLRPVLEELPNIAGSKGEKKKYIILFQNDNELRPTGGFLTAYAVVEVENGKIFPVKSDDIYELDQRFKEKIDIPEALGRYLTTEKYWNLRDMNTSPDFKVSMDQFFTHYQAVPGEPENIDGIIAVDTNVLTGLLSILGPVEVPGYGQFSAENDPRCDCPQVVYALSEIITKPTPYHREDRKGILGPMMAAILMKTYGAPKQYFADLFQFGWQSLESKYVQLYFTDEKAQLAAEAINAAGRIKPVENQDFLAIINANLGGAKSNLFTNYQVKQIVAAPKDGQLQKTVEITYKNTRKADNCNLEAGQLCLNSTLQDWTRLYLPQGAKLVKAQGFTMEPKEYQEAGFSVIDGFFTLEPLGVAKIIVTYTVPYENQDVYQVMLWKQAGIEPFETMMEVTGGQEKITIDKDQVYEVEF
ncbi:MAG: DUF4012 domain-containing protein [Candidatus Pacebacteria bacterium]|nr:DUF4012 domain-containing protein [Candidatus Paceibacterota bacterium]